MKERVYMDAMSMMQWAGSWLVGFVAILQDLVGYVLYFDVGPLAITVLFSMVVSILVHSAVDEKSSSTKKGFLLGVYLAIIVGLFIGIAAEIWGSDASGGDLYDMGSALNLATISLLLIIGVLIITGLVMWKHKHGMGIQIGLLVAMLFLQWAIAGWVFTTGAVVVTSIVAVGYVLAVKQ